MSIALLVLGLALAFGSCVVFPSQFGSDYAAINAGGILGTALGVIVTIIAAAVLFGGKGGPDHW